MAKKKQVMAGDIPVYCSHDELVDVVKLIGNPRNPNTHDDKQIELLARIIREQGWRKPITVSTRSGFVVSGHGRLQAALLLGAETAPVDYQDYATEADEWADLIADNRLAELSEIDDSLLNELLEDLKEFEDFNFELTGYSDIMLDEEMSNDDIESFFEDTQQEENSEDSDNEEDKHTVKCPECGAKVEV